MDLPLLSALAAAAALSFYILLDGFDLGVGAMLLAIPPHLRNRAVASIAPTWDGNETWLIMAGVALLAAFPIAYGILLPAFYLPLIIMLLSLGLRGVSFEFRHQARRSSHFWDRAFCLGSIIATFCQGLIVGGLVQGVTVRNASFAGSVTDVLSIPAALTGVTLVTGNIMLGAGWLHLKTDGELKAFATGALKVAATIFMVLAAGTCACMALVQPRVLDLWFTHPRRLALIVLGAIALAGIVIVSAGKRSDRLPFLAGLGIYALGLAGLAQIIFPFAVPFSTSLWDAASPTLSHVFLLVGVAIVGPVVLAYTAFAYYVFRGRTPQSGWDP